MLEKIDGNTFFISDTHLGHLNILKFTKSRSVEMKKKNMINQDDWIKYNWNQTCQNDNTIIHCGDLSYKGKSNVINNLNGKKFLLKGNHDDLSFKEYTENGFNLINNLVLIDKFKKDLVFLKQIKSYSNLKSFNFILFEYDNLRFLVSHFPIIDTQGYDKKYESQINGLKWIFEYCQCDYNLHGHTHENNMNYDQCVNISFEQTNFKPITLNDIIKKIRIKEILKKK